MLKIGQKVQIKNDCCYLNAENDIIVSPYRGEITVITEYYQGNHPYTKGLELYYTDLMPHPFERTVLLPLDDHPCDTEFLEEFNKLIEDKVTCTE